ncbi:MAG: SDR family NAD(P)-dependent oxidoreductase [Alistipes sp.]
MKQIIIIGATSGIGLATARIYIAKGWRVGVAGRRIEALETLQREAPSQVEIAQIDITNEDAPIRLNALIIKLGGMDIYLHCAGVGSQNTALEPSVEIATAQTNVTGFIRMVTAAFAHFRAVGGGQIAAISSIAGTRGLGVAPAYSATKRFQNTYLDALAQLAHMEHLPIRITDIRPGFVATALLRDGNYPMLMQPEKVAAQIVRAVEKQKRRIVIDRRYALLVFFWRLLPQGLWERLTVKTKR